MSAFLPVVYSAHHAGHAFGSFVEHSALTLKQRVRYSDYGTDDTVPTHTKYFVSTLSRGIVDLNRGPESLERFPTKDFGRKKVDGKWISDKHAIWTNTPPQSERSASYHTYHRQLYLAIEEFADQIVELRAKEWQPVVVVAWDNTAHYYWDNKTRGTIVLSNNGDPRQGDTKNPDKFTLTCDAEFLVKLAENLGNLLETHDLRADVELNTYEPTPNDEPGYIARHYNTRWTPELLGGWPNVHVEALQVEYDTILTHDQDTLMPYYQKMEKLRLAFAEAMTKTYDDRWRLG